MGKIPSVCAGGAGKLFRGGGGVGEERAQKQRYT